MGNTITVMLFLSPLYSSRAKGQVSFRQARSLIGALIPLSPMDPQTMYVWKQLMNFFLNRVISYHGNAI